MQLGPAAAHGPAQCDTLAMGICKPLAKIADASRDTHLPETALALIRYAFIVLRTEHNGRHA